MSDIGKNAKNKWLIAVSVTALLCMVAMLVCMIVMTSADSVRKDGKSAYEIAVEYGYAGTEREWIESLNGEAGGDGTLWHSGADAPSPSQGKDGDFYIDTSDSRLYRKEDGVWQFIAELNAKPCNHVFAPPVITGLSGDGAYWLAEERCTLEGCGYYITRQKPVEEEVSSFRFEADNAEALAAILQNGVGRVFLSDGANIALTEDISAEGVIEIEEGSTVALDLNGHELVSSCAGAFIINHGVLTVDDGGNGGAVYTTDTAEQGRAALINYGTATVNGGSFGSNRSRGQAFTNLGTATVNGGSFTSCDNYVNNGYAYAIGNGRENYPDAVMTINDATVSGNMNGVLANDGGTMTVKGGTFILGDGDAGKSYYMAYASSGSLVIEGGVFIRNVKNAHGFICSDGGTVDLKGGAFEDRINGDVIVKGGYVTKISARFDGCVFRVENSRIAVREGVTIAFAQSQAEMREEDSLFDGYIQYSDLSVGQTAEIMRKILRR